MALFRIPFANIPQRFAIELTGTTYTLENRWNGMNEGGCWEIDVYDENESPIVMGIPLVTGSDLFEQFEYLGLPSPVIVFTDGDETAIPTLDNLGGDANVWLVTA